MDCNLYLHGGGTRLPAHVGALTCLEDHGVHVASWAGTSAGSLVAAVVCAGGYSMPRAYDLMLETDYKQFLDIRPFRMFRNLGLCSGKRFEKWLDNILGGARFRSLDAPLSIVAADVCTGRAHIFSHDNTPEAKIATAVRCSIGIPGIFGVRKTAEGTFVDGSLAKVEPRQLFPDDHDPSILIRLKSNLDDDLPYRKKFRPISYMRRVVEMMFRCAEDLCSPEQFTHDLELRVSSSAAFTFGITPDQKHKLFDEAYRHTHDYLMNLVTARIDSDPPPKNRVAPELQFAVSVP